MVASHPAPSTQLQRPFALSLRPCTSPGDPRCIRTHAPLAPTCGAIGTNLLPLSPARRRFITHSRIAPLPIQGATAVPSCQHHRSGMGRFLTPGLHTRRFTPAKCGATSPSGEQAATQPIWLPFPYHASPSPSTSSPSPSTSDPQPSPSTPSPTTSTITSASEPLSSTSTSTSASNTLPDAAFADEANLSAVALFGLGREGNLGGAGAGSGDGQLTAAAEFILSHRPAAVVVQRPVTHDHGAVPGATIVRGDPDIAIGPEADLLDDMCYAAEQLRAEKCEPERSEVWAQVMQHYTPWQLVYIAALAVGSKLVAGDRPTHITIRRLASLCTARQLDVAYGALSERRYRSALRQCNGAETHLTEATRGSGGGGGSGGDGRIGSSHSGGSGDGLGAVGSSGAGRGAGSALSGIGVAADHLALLILEQERAAVFCKVVHDTSIQCQALLQSQPSLIDVVAVAEAEQVAVIDALWQPYREPVSDEWGRMGEGVEAGGWGEGGMGEGEEGGGWTAAGLGEEGQWREGGARWREEAQAVEQAEGREEGQSHLEGQGRGKANAGQDAPSHTTTPLLHPPPQWQLFFDSPLLGACSILGTASPPPVLTARYERPPTRPTLRPAPRAPPAPSPLPRGQPTTASPAAQAAPTTNSPAAWGSERKLLEHSPPLQPEQWEPPPSLSPRRGVQHGDTPAPTPVCPPLPRRPPTPLGSRGDASTLLATLLGPPRGPVPLGEESWGPTPPLTPPYPPKPPPPPPQTAQSTPAMAPGKDVIDATGTAASSDGPAASAASTTPSATPGFTASTAAPTSTALPAPPAFTASTAVPTSPALPAPAAFTASTAVPTSPALPAPPAFTASTAVPTSPALPAPAAFTASTAVPTSPALPAPAAPTSPAAALSYIDPQLLGSLGTFEWEAVSGQAVQAAYGREAALTGPERTALERDVAARRGLLHAVVQLAMPDKLADVAEVLGLVSPSSLLMVAAVEQLYGSSRMQLACLPPDLLRRVCVGWGCDMQQVLEPYRCLRASFGGPVFSEEEEVQGELGELQGPRYLETWEYEIAE